MDEMLGYIFGNLKNSESAIRNVNRTLSVQNRINRKFTSFSLVAALGFAVVTMVINEQSRQINKLTKEIEQMKKPNDYSYTPFEGCCDNRQTE